MDIFHDPVLISFSTVNTLLTEKPKVGYIYTYTIVAYTLTHLYNIHILFYTIVYTHINTHTYKAR